MNTEGTSNAGSWVNFEPHHLDALQEVGNIAAAHGATALSKLIRESILIDVTDCRILHVEDLPNSLERIKDEVVAAFINVNETENDSDGTILMVFPHDMAIYFSDALLKKTRDPSDEIGEDDKSALSEIGNICACAYLNAISKFLEVTLMPSPPGLAVDKLTPILEFPACVIGEKSEYAVVIETQIICKEKVFYGVLLFMPNLELQGMMFERFGLDKVSP